MSSTASPVLLDDNLRKILGPNPHLSDNKLLRSWEYAVWMLSYCVACTLFGVLAVTLLPDPRTLELIRGGGRNDDQIMEAAQNMMTVAQDKVDSDGYKQGYGAMDATQNIAAAFGSMDDTNWYYQGSGGQNGTDGQEAGGHGTHAGVSNAAQGTKDYRRYRAQIAGAVASDGPWKKKPSTGYSRYRGTAGKPPNNDFDYWAPFINKQKTYLKSSLEERSPENISPPTLHQVNGDGGRSEDSQGPLSSKESSYTSYSSLPS